jgi:hypothetical protein
MEGNLTGILDRRLVLLVTCIFCFFVVLPPQARAAIIESRTSDGQTLSQRANDLNAVRTMLEQDIVVQRLADYGYSKEEALMKIENASDAQLHQLASLSDNLAAGADGLGIIVTLLVIILLVILIMKLSDKQVIIK